MHLNITELIIYAVRTFGYLGIGSIIFAESGLLLGFILPGDSLIFLAGLMAAQGYFNLAVLIAVSAAAAAAGDNLGYLIGKRLGRRVFEKKDSFIFNQKNLQKTEAFFERYGRSTFLIERFIPIIRTFAPLLAGVGNMRYSVFFLFDLIGTILWSVVIIVLGFYLGSAIPNVDSYLVPLIFIIVAVSFIPTFFTYRKHRKPGV